DGLHASIRDGTDRNAPDLGEKLVGEGRQHAGLAFQQNQAEALLKPVALPEAGLEFQAQPFSKVVRLFDLSLVGARGQLFQGVRERRELGLRAQVFERLWTDLAFGGEQLLRRRDLQLQACQVVREEIGQEIQADELRAQLGLELPDFVLDRDEPVLGQ